VSERLVVVGGDAAGMSAASNARRRRPPEDLEIVAFERGHFTSYSACGIPYYVGDVVEELDELIARTPETFREKYAIEARTGTEVMEIDADKQAVRVRALADGSETWEGYDDLVIATGAIPVRPDLPGADAEGIYGVQVLDDGTAIRRVVERDEPRRAVVVGGGYIGIEMAEAFLRKGMEVSLVEMGAQPMPTLDPDMGAIVADAMRDLGIKVYTNEPVTAFETDGGKVAAVVTGERTLPVDIVVTGLGARPNSELARAAGLPVGVTGGIVVDRRLRTEVDGVWAAGDCAEKFHRVSRKPVSFALGTHANKEGRIAGINIGGGYATFPGVIGTAATLVCGLEIARTGLKESEADEGGFEHLSVVIDSTTRAGYYPDASPIKLKLVVEKRSGKLLGAQIVGRTEAAKRIDALATALWNEMTVDEMLNLDLAYAPPFSPVWDPILIAARKAWSRVEETLSEC
jgi:NADPH-dependent 2,4-dienoyl-CoA reductase/sulfur reductase-like enzyme